MHRILPPAIVRSLRKSECALKWEYWVDGVPLTSNMIPRLRFATPVLSMSMRSEFPNIYRKEMGFPKIPTYELSPHDTLKVRVLD